MGQPPSPSPSLVLASTSPRRKDLLALLEVPFAVAEPDFTEQVDGNLTPERLARRFALGKAESCSARFPDRLILGSDTLIEIGGAVLGKPADIQEARGMLKRLIGREHLIHTAVAVLRQADTVQALAVETVRVWMTAWTDHDLESYLATGESLGKAGAYSIQGLGGNLIRKIDGDYTAAVGLPLRATAALLHKCGLTPPVDIDAVYRRKPYPNWARFAS
jgi:septum formation protein